MSVPSPKSFNVPHEEWRKGQYEAFKNIKDAKRNIVIAAAPTGSGKSMICAALGSKGKSVKVLTHTRALQNQYLDYDFDVLYGMAGYKCELNKFFNASFCAYRSRMFECPVAHNCEYLIQREITKESFRQSISYAYYLKASWPQKNPTDYMYLDEAHLVPHLVMNYMSISITPEQCSRLGISQYPIINGDAPQIMRRVKATKWCSESLHKMTNDFKELESIKDKTEYQLRKRNKLEELTSKFSLVIRAINKMPEHFFFHSDERLFRILPLTASPFFKRIFQPGGQKIILTSATIGNPRTFAGTLGINSNEYHWVNTPSNFTPEQMPIYIYRDAPRMSHANKETKMLKQIDIIKAILRARDPSWHSLIHTSSKADAKFLAQKLSVAFGERVHLTSEETNTSKKVENWKKQINKQPGTVAISWTFHTGLDAPEARINIVQKIPFGMLDEPGKALQKLSPRFYNWSAANKVEQSVGRIRRGDLSHYESPDEHENRHVAILDMNLSIVKRETSDHFQRCLNYI